MFRIYEKSSYGLTEIESNSIHAAIMDPPYGINLEEWDTLPDNQIWADCLRVLKPGGFLLCFSSIKFQHIFTQNLLNAGFEFKDVLLWAYLNGRVPPINLDKKVDSLLNNERDVIGEYNYIQGSPNSKKKDSYTIKNKKTKATDDSEKWVGFGTGLKTAYEPIIMVQKPIEKSLAENVLKYHVGALNIDSTRIPFEDGETDVGHNPHPLGRVMSNIIQTENFGDFNKYFNINSHDETDHFLFYSKVRDGKKTGNIHPTKKPVQLMQQLIKLVTLENQIVLDPFMGSGSTGVAANLLKRQFIGYEKEHDYFLISQERLKSKI